MGQESTKDSPITWRYCISTTCSEPQTPPTKAKERPKPGFADKCKVEDETKTSGTPLKEEKSKPFTI